MKITASLLIADGLVNFCQETNVEDYVLCLGRPPGGFQRRGNANLIPRKGHAWWFACLHVTFFTFFHV